LLAERCVGSVDSSQLSVIVAGVEGVQIILGRRGRSEILIATSAARQRPSPIVERALIVAPAGVGVARRTFFQDDAFHGLLLTRPPFVGARQRQPEHPRARLRKRPSSAGETKSMTRCAGSQARARWHPPALPNRPPEPS